MTEFSEVNSANNIKAPLCEVDSTKEANWCLNIANIDSQPFKVAANNKHFLSLPASIVQ